MIFSDLNIELTFLILVGDDSFWSIFLFNSSTYFYKSFKSTSAFLISIEFYELWWMLPPKDMNLL